MSGVRVADAPPGWRIARIGDIFDSWGGHTPSKTNKTYWGEGVHWVSSKDVKSSRLSSSTHSVTQKAVEETGLRICPTGSVLIVVRSGILAHTLPVSVTQIPVTINQDLKAFHSDEPLLNEWLALFLRMSARRLLASSRRDGTTVQSVRYPLLKDTLIPVPPVEQRRRLIDSIEEILADQADVSPRLLSARQMIERYRQAVLAAACSGRLTGDWRREHPDARVASLELLGEGKRAKRRHRSAVTVDIRMPDVPESYVITPLSEIASVLEYGTSRKSDGGEADVPVLRMGNIQDGALDLSDLKYITTDKEVERLLLADGDLLFNRTNSPELVGKSAVWHDSTSATFASYLIRVRFCEEAALPDFVNYWINSAWGRIWARRVKTDGVSQSNINGTKLGAMPVPLPPLDEQREIVRRVEGLLRGSEEILAKVDAASSLLERTGQSALAKACRGEI